MKTIKVFISGDFAPRHRVSEVISNKEFSLLFGDVLPYIRQADISITNLESPLIDEGNPIPKTGPNLKSPSESVEALKFAGFDMVTLANNHMMDYGTEGLNSTISICENNGIRCIGAGTNITEASKVCHIAGGVKQLPLLIAVKMNGVRRTETGLDVILSMKSIYITKFKKLKQMLTLSF